MVSMTYVDLCIYNSVLDDYHPWQSSGVAVSDECIKVFEEVKMKHKWLYIIFRVSDDLRSIIVEEKAGHGE